MTGTDASYDPEMLDALACDIGARPAEAPHFTHVAGAVRAVRREAGALVVDYDPAVAATLAAVVEAERRCCGDVGWSLERVAPDGVTGAATGKTGGGAGDAGDGVLRLRVAASPTQLDALVLLFAPPCGEAGAPEAGAPEAGAAGERAGARGSRLTP